MLKLCAKYIRQFQMIVDMLTIGLAWWIAFEFRFQILRSGQQGLHQTFVFWFCPLVFISIYFMMKNHLYERALLPPFASDAMDVIRANTISLLVFVVLLYFGSDGRISRLSILTYAGISTVFLLIARAFTRSVIRKLRRRGFLLKKIFVVGDGKQIVRYLETIRYTPGSGLDPVAAFGCVSRSKDALCCPQFNLDDLQIEIKRQEPDIVVLGFADESNPFVSEFIQRFYDSLFTIQVLPAEHRALVGLTAELFQDVHLLTYNQPVFSAPELAAKRIVDFFGSAIGLLVLSPIFLAVGVAIKLTSRGPILYSQERVGQDGNKFKMLKFRSMKQVSGSVAGWTIKDDPRRTLVGTLLRSSSIDELPQLWNVFVGQMSLVGPRPEQPFFVEKFRAEIPAYMLRHKMKAGITGWAQINGWRGDTSLHKRIECDLYYIRNWSFWFDFKILLMTFVKGFVNKNAY